MVQFEDPGILFGPSFAGPTTQLACVVRPRIDLFLDIERYLSIVGLRDPVERFKDILAHAEIGPAREAGRYRISLFRAQLSDTSAELSDLGDISQFFGGNDLGTTLFL